jgi:hypothetical protein
MRVYRSAQPYVPNLTNSPVTAYVLTIVGFPKLRSIIVRALQTTHDDHKGTTDENFDGTYIA